MTWYGPDWSGARGSTPRQRVPDGAPYTPYVDPGYQTPLSEVVNQTPMVRKENPTRPAPNPLDQVVNQNPGPSRTDWTYDSGPTWQVPPGSGPTAYGQSSTPLYQGLQSIHQRGYQMPYGNVDALALTRLLNLPPDQSRALQQSVTGGAGDFNNDIDIFHGPEIGPQSTAGPMGTGYSDQGLGGRNAASYDPNYEPSILHQPSPPELPPTAPWNTNTNSFYDPTGSYARGEQEYEQDRKRYEQQKKSQQTYNDNPENASFLDELAVQGQKQNKSAKKPPKVSPEVFKRALKNIWQSL